MVPRNAQCPTRPVRPERWDRLIGDGLSGESPALPVRAYIALGANLGDAVAALRRAAMELGALPLPRLYMA